MTTARLSKGTRSCVTRLLSVTTSSKVDASWGTITLTRSVSAEPLLAPARMVASWTRSSRVT